MYGSNQGIRVNILFGNACNMKCSYCLQDKQSVSKGDPESFSEKFIEQATQKNLSIESFHYQGGEPLLYWKGIKTVLSYMYDAFPNASLHRITTNGTLINSDYVTFCNARQKIKTILSLHKFQLSDESYANLSKVNNLYLNGICYHQKNKPSHWIHDWEHVTFKMNRRIPFGFYPFHATANIPDDVVPTVKDIDECFKDLLFNILPMAMDGDYFAQSVILSLCGYCEHRSNSLKASPCYNDSVLSLDLLGNTYACHHNASKKNIIGNIFEHGKVISIHNSDHNKFFTSAECQKCEALSICYGGCYLSKTHDVECRWHKLLWLFWQHVRSLQI